MPQCTTTSRVTPSLKSFFKLPKNQFYFCAHSLGLMPMIALDSLSLCTEIWGDQAVQGWNEWINLPKQLGAQIASLIGAKAEEVIVTDNTSINLFKALSLAMKLNSARHVILIEEQDFPTNRYIAQDICANGGFLLQQVATEEILSSLSADIAVLLLTHVNYRTGFMHNMAAITQRAHELGILVIWDLSHSVGTMPLLVSSCGVDFAVGCTYKYLNGGPGAPSFIYAHRRHHDKLRSPIAGWMGHATPFQFAEEYIPASGVGVFLSGTPSLLSMQALAGALKVFLNLDLQALRDRSCYLSQYFLEQIQVAPELVCLSPHDPAMRGSHLAFTHPQAEQLSKQLIAQGIICDYRQPALIRFGISPLYHDTQDIQQVAQKIISLLRRGV